MKDLQSHPHEFCERGVPRAQMPPQHIIEAARALEVWAKARNVCPECGNQVDPEVCHCGDPIKNHSAEHRPVPMGCTCGYNQPDERPFA